MFGCEICGKTIYDPDEDNLCYSCVCKAKKEYLNKYKKK